LGLGTPPLKKREKKKKNYSFVTGSGVLTTYKAVGFMQSETDKQTPVREIYVFVW